MVVHIFRKGEIPLICELAIASRYLRPGNYAAEALISRNDLRITSSGYVTIFEEGTAPLYQPVQQGGTGEIASLPATIGEECHWLNCLQAVEKKEVEIILRNLEETGVPALSLYAENIKMGVTPLTAYGIALGNKNNDAILNLAHMRINEASKRGYSDLMVEIHKETNKKR